MNSNQTITEFVIIGLSGLGQFRLLFFFCLLIVFLLIITGNMLISLVIFFDRHLHTPMYFFICMLSFLEVCCAAITVPGMLAIAWAGRTQVTTTSCFLQMYLIHALGITENYILIVMAYDRFLAICKPLHYHAIMTAKICKILVCCCCFFGFMLSLSLLVLVSGLPFCGSREIYHIICDSSPVLHLACADVSVIHIIEIAIGLWMIIFTALFILFIYIKIMITIMNMRQMKERTKAFSTCIAHFVVVLLFYGSVTFMYIILHGNYTSEYEEAVAINYSILSPLINPIIYIFRNKEIKKSLMTFLQPLILINANVQTATI